MGLPPPRTLPVACDSKRHTAENIKVWTEEALKDIGLTAANLVEEEEEE